MRTVAIIQARMGSKRLPGKVMMLLGDKPILQHVIERTKLAKRVTQVVLATSYRQENEVLMDLATSCNIQSIMTYPENNVLRRYYITAKRFEADIIVRITADCPFIEPILIDRCIDLLEARNAEYVSVGKETGYPDGTDVEAFSFRVLQETHHKAITAYDKEHVTSYMYNSRRYETDKVVPTDVYTNRPEINLCVDTQKDLEYVREIYSHLPEKYNLRVILDTIDEHKICHR